MNYIKITESGYISGLGSTTAELQDIPVLAGETAIEVVEVPENYGSQILLYRDGAVVNTGQPVRSPAPGWVWDDDTLKWVDGRTLDDLKAAKWEEIKAARSNAEYGGFSWDGSEFDSDAASQQKIMGASQLAGLDPDNFLVDWTLKDNTVRTLNAADMNAVGAALGQHVNSQYVKARNLRQQIESATTKAEVEAIAW